jgi:hypothetical protein
MLSGLPHRLLTVGNPASWGAAIVTAARIAPDIIHSHAHSSRRKSLTLAPGYERSANASGDESP